MSTVGHVLASCSRLRTTWGLLAEAITPGRARPRNQRILTPAQHEAREARHRYERATKYRLVNAGTIVGGGQPPVPLDTVQARTHIISEIEEVAGEITLRISTVRRIGLRRVSGYLPSGGGPDARFANAIDWISTSIVHVTDVPILGNAHHRLDQADRYARTLLGDHGARRRFASPCPCCNRRTLAWDETSVKVEEWFVECSSDDCRCRGTGCPCAIPNRQHGMTHVWTTQNWRTLAAKLE